MLSMVQNDALMHREGGGLTLSTLMSTTVDYSIVFFM